MRILSIPAMAASLIFISLNTAHAAQNCMLLTESDAVRECFDRTFSATSKAEKVPAQKTAKPKLVAPPKTQSVSDGSPR